MKKALLFIALIVLLSSQGFANNYIVTNCLNTGAGSLRAAVANCTGNDTIIFDITTVEAGYSSGAFSSGLVSTEAGSDRWFRIVLSSNITISDLDGIRIIGSSQTREATNTIGPKVEIRSSSGLNDSGLIIFQSSYCTIEGLAINGFNGGIGNAGIKINASTNGSNPSEHNQVLGCYLGTTATGEVAYANRIGILVQNDSRYNLIGNGTVSGRNLISGNANSGIHFITPGGGSMPTYNEVAGNYIGFGRDGEKRLINGYNGIWLQLSNDNIIGKPFAGGGNVILGVNNGSYAGIMIDGSLNNYIFNNIVGLTKSGALPTTRGYRGVMLDNGASWNYLGWSGDYQGNVISGANDGLGYDIYLTGTSTRNAVAGNTIGFSTNGETNAQSTYGIYLDTNSHYNLIGTSESGGGNVVTGGIYGIHLSGVNYNRVYNNIVGLTSSEAIPSTKVITGIRLGGTSSYNAIGGTGPNEGNIISGASNSGLTLYNCPSNEVAGNIVGSDSSQALDRGNGLNGIDVFQPSSFHNTIGPSNVVVYNDQYGIDVTSADNNVIKGNYVGTDSNCTIKRGNAQRQIQIYESSYNVVGPSNVVAASGASYHGIEIWGDSQHNQVKENYLGTDPTGVKNLGNSRSGILIFNTPYNIVGPSNIIAFNNENGVWVDGAAATKETITQNSIYNNTGKGINLSSGGNHEMASPALITADYSEVTGLTSITGEGAPNNGTVEAFKAQGGQGKTYLGSAIADGTGKWSLSASGLVSGDAVTATGTTANPETSQFSTTIEARTVEFAAYQPDLAAGILSDGSDYKTIGVYEDTPVTQVQSLSVNSNEAAVFYFKQLNAGNATDTITVSGEGSSGSFTIKYLAGKTGTTEVVIPDTSVMASGESGEGRVQITYSGNNLTTKEVTITATTTNDAAKKDAVKVIATFVPLPEPVPPTPTGHATQEFTEAQLGITGMHITIPAGACTVDVTVTASIVPDLPSLPPAGYEVGGNMIDIVCNPINTFLEPVTVTIPIIGPLAAPKVFYWTGSSWSTDGIVIISHTATSLTFTTMHFTMFVPLAPAPNNLVRFGPNPYNPNNGSGRFWYWLNADSDTTIYLIDLAGSVAWKQTYIAGTNGGKAGENNIEYDGKTAWGDQLGQGVYVYKIVQGGKAIGGGKIAVIK